MYRCRRTADDNAAAATQLILTALEYKYVTCRLVYWQQSAPSREYASFAVCRARASQKHILRYMYYNTTQ